MIPVQNTRTPIILVQRTRTSFQFSILTLTFFYVTYAIFGFYSFEGVIFHRSIISSATESKSPRWDPWWMDRYLADFSRQRKFGENVGTFHPQPLHQSVWMTMPWWILMWVAPSNCLIAVHDYFWNVIFCCRFQTTFETRLTHWWIKWPLIITTQGSPPKNYEKTLRIWWAHAQSKTPVFFAWCYDFGVILGQKLGRWWA